jgi:hypothetical protein
VTANELLTLLGRAWSRLLIYPGGLAAFGIVWLIHTIQDGRTAEPQNQFVERLNGSRFLVLGSSIPPWLALALLPLPLAVALPRQIDIVTVLALLECPNLLMIRRDLRAGDMRRLAAALNSYPPLILATLALAQAGNSLELTALARPPGDLSTTSVSVLHWLGAIALALVLPAALGIGPFVGGPEPENRRAGEQHTPDTGHRTPLRLRGLGFVLLAALPWAGAEGTGVALLRMLGAAALIAALLWGFDRLTRGHAARRWAWAYLILDAALLLALLWAAYLALQSRLV